jgi:hypothetical protein
MVSIIMIGVWGVVLPFRFSCSQFGIFLLLILRRRPTAITNLQSTIAILLGVVGIAFGAN